MDRAPWPLVDRYGDAFTPSDPRSFVKAVRKELELLKTSLPPGILVKAFADRMVSFKYVVIVHISLNTCFS